jgi:hypothetical protein
MGVLWPGRAGIEARLGLVVLRAMLLAKSEALHKRFAASRSPSCRQL